MNAKEGLYHTLAVFRADFKEDAMGKHCPAVGFCRSGRRLHTHHRRAAALQRRSTSAWKGSPRKRRPTKVPFAMLCALPSVKIIPAGVLDAALERHLSQYLKKLADVAAVQLGG